ncbi:MAG: acetamidase/formamidase family protein [Deltaproteobacteria bacterium]|nr:acetamidase/formamidase family protein [Deltaproteobacteria bacterium]
MKRATKERVCYAMSADNKPVLRVSGGEPFRLEVEDCYSGNLRTPEDVFTKEMWGTVNPATGPVFVEGARAGDVLRVEIEEIEIRDYAVMCVEKGSGALGDYIEGVETSIYPIRDGLLHAGEGLSIPIRPMIGVIGTAPEGGVILNGTPGEHGGNMDCREITAGSRVYLPVNVEGALLCVGDLHALMGDGEVCICGAEVSGEVALRVDPVASSLPTPCVETDESVYFISSALTLDECERAVLGKTHTYLTEMLGLRPNEAARIMSLVGHLQVCQVVDPLKTMRFALPKWLLRSRGMDGDITGSVRSQGGSS